MRGRPGKLQLQITAMQHSNKRTETLPRFVTNSATKKCHIRATDEVNLPNHFWAAWCGFNHGISKFTRARDTPKGFTDCLRCVRYQRLGKLPGQALASEHMSTPEVKPIDFDELQQQSNNRPAAVSAQIQHSEDASTRHTDIIHPQTDTTADSYSRPIAHSHGNSGQTNQYCHGEPGDLPLTKT